MNGTSSAPHRSRTDISPAKALGRIGLAIGLTALYLVAALARQDPVVEAPRLGMPAILEGGAPFPVELRLPLPMADLLPIRIALEREGEAFPLAVDKTHRSGALTIMSTRLPYLLAPGPYDLAVEVSGRKLVRPKAVHAVDYFPDEFYFVHVNDVRVMEGDTSRAEILRSAVEEINIIHPAFVLFTGDLCDKGRWSEYERFLSIVSRLDVPVICAPGNHEYKGLAGYLTYFGRPYHASRYGGLRILTLDSGHGRDQWTRSQFRWAARQLSSAREVSEPVVIQQHHPIFGHRNVSGMKGAYLDLLERYRVPIVLTGHWHADAVYNRDGRRQKKVWDFEGTKFVVTTSVGAPLNRRLARKKDPYFGYRLVRMRGEEVVAYTYDLDGDGARDPICSIPIGHVRLLREAAGRARLENDLNEAFEDARVGLWVPRDGRLYQPSAGEVMGIFPGEETVRFEVRVALPPRSVVEVEMVEHEH